MIEYGVIARARGSKDEFKEQEVFLSEKKAIDLAEKLSKGQEVIVWKWCRRTPNSGSCWTIWHNLPWLEPIREREPCIDGAPAAATL